MSKTPEPEEIGTEIHRQAEELNTIDPRPEAQRYRTTEEESKLIARINEAVAKQVQILKTGAIPYRIPTEPTELPGALEPGKVTADPAHVEPTEDGWFSSPDSDILRRPVNDVRKR